MQAQKEWVKPELTLYGSVESITEETFSKSAGSGDNIVFVIPGQNDIVITTGQTGTLSQVS